MNNITSDNLKRDISEKNINQISDNLLFFLKEEINDTKIVYEIGGFIWTQPPIQNELINIIYEFSKTPVEVPR